MISAHEPNRKWWNEVTSVHVASKFYDVPAFIEGKNTLDQIELSGVGDVTGKTLLHLQCHFGLATLSFARMGAKVTGMDFSEEGIKAAQELAKQIGQEHNSRFLCCDVLELDEHLNGQFDIVFTSYGVITWLSNLDRWAQIVAKFLKPGGKFFIAEIHPTGMLFDNDQSGWQIKYDYFHREEPLILQDYHDYADPNFKPQEKTHDWIWSMSDILRALWKAGLTITDFQEYPFSCFQQYPHLVERDGNYYIPEDSYKIPLIFTLTATK
jgi:2-polyprenyl-3-methyl-5-hydroxy-6-metoxy-1,4-benzoquinol methylase